GFWIKVEWDFPSLPPNRFCMSKTKHVKNLILLFENKLFILDLYSWVQILALFPKNCRGFLFLAFNPWEQSMLPSTKRSKVLTASHTAPICPCIARWTRAAFLCPLCRPLLVFMLQF